MEKFEQDKSKLRPEVTHYILVNSNNKKESIDETSHLNENNDESKAGVDAKVLQQIFTVFTASLLIFTDGVSVGWISPAVAQLLANETEIHVTKDDTFLLTSMLSFGSIFGPVIFTYFVNRSGRKCTILLLHIPLKLAALCLFFATTINHILFAEFLMGTGFFFAIDIVTVYTVEISSPKLRSSLATLVFAMLSMGIFVGTTTSSYLDIKSNALIILITSSISFLLALTILESPYYFLRKNDLIGVRNTLKKLYHKDCVMSIYCNLIEKFNFEKNSNQITLMESIKQLILVKNNRKLFSLIVLLYTLSAFSGCMIIRSYFTILLKQSQITLISVEVATLLITTVSLTFTLLTTVLLSIISRRVLFLISLSATTALSITLAVFYWCTNNGYLLQYSFIPFILLLLFFTFASFGFFSFHQIYLRELAPSNLIAIIAFIIGIFHPAIVTLSLYVFDKINVIFDNSVAFLMLAIFNFIYIFVIIVFIPETKNKTLEQIQDEYNKVPQKIQES